MSKKRIEINPVRGERLKILLREKRIDQQTPADKIGYSKEHISYVVNGRRNLTEGAARAIIRLFPDIRIEWLMGYDEFKTIHEKNVTPLLQALEKADDESQKLTTGVLSFLSLTNYKLRLVEKDGNSVSDLLKQVHDFAIIEHESQQISLSISEFNNLENEILDYIQLRMKYLFRQKEGQ